MKKISPPIIVYRYMWWINGNTANINCNSNTQWSHLRNDSCCSTVVETHWCNKINFHIYKYRDIYAHSWLRTCLHPFLACCESAHQTCAHAQYNAYIVRFKSLCMDGFTNLTRRTCMHISACESIHLATMFCGVALGLSWPIYLYISPTATCTIEELVFIISEFILLHPSS